VAKAAEDAAERRFTRDVDLSAVRDLLDRPRQAAVAFVDDDAVDLLPVQARCAADTYLFGLLDGSPDLISREVVLVVDAGPYWFQLRGVSIRGIAERAEPPEPGAAEGLVWYAIDARRILAWDYGSIRKE
jgi:hypothetical protein